MAHDVPDDRRDTRREVTFNDGRPTHAADVDLGKLGLADRDRRIYRAEIIDLAADDATEYADGDDPTHNSGDGSGE